MTLASILTSLRTDAGTFLALKAEMLVGKVAGAWEAYDESKESEDKRVKNSSWVRFTPVVYSDRMVTGVVASVRKKVRQGEPLLEYFDFEGDWKEDHDRWLEGEKRRESYPWTWQIDYLLDARGTRRKTAGDAKTKAEAMKKADAALKKHDWTLLLPDLERLAAVKEDPDG